MHIFLKISEKDQSLLDERIKRAAKNRPTKTVSSTKTRITQVQAPTNDSNELDENNYEDEPEDEPKIEEENDELVLKTILRVLFLKNTAQFFMLLINFCDYKSFKFRFSLLIFKSNHEINFQKHSISISTANTSTTAATTAETAGTAGTS